MLSPVVASGGPTASALERKREVKWAKMLGFWEKYTMTKATKLKRRVRKGVPDSQRRAAWNHLVPVHAYLTKFPGLYERLSGGPGGGSEPPQEDASEMIQSHRDIELDLYRTFPEHAAFARGTARGEAGVAALRRVLRAHAAFDPELGYCQSLNFLAATLLMYLPEREAFWHFVALMQRAEAPLRGLYLKGMAQTQATLNALDGLVAVHLPRLARHLEAEGCSSAMFATEWYMTVFTRSFPVAFTARVLDCFLSEGTKVVHRVALALLQSIEVELLRADLGGIMMLIRELPGRFGRGDGAAEAGLMEAAFRFDLKRSQVERAAAAPPRDP